MPPPFISKREVARAWQILKVVSRFGLVPLLQASGIGRLFGVRIWRRMERRYQHTPPPVRIRMALTELGTTFIKLGQVLSARSDLLPQEYLDELAKLQDDVPPFPFAEIEPVFRAEFGISPFDAFRDFNPEPLASASIGQVYAARLQDGADIVVKIQRPGVEAQIATDLSLLHRAATWLQRYRQLERYDLPALVREFRAILQDELIYTLEAHNAETLNEQMDQHPLIAFPRVHWPYTSHRVLTLHRVFGHKITDLPALDALGLNRRELAVNLANSLLEQILLHGLFHGDPHPGNLLVTPDGGITFLDTGMVGRLDRKMRELLIELAVSIFDQDIDAVLGNLQQLGVVQDIANLPQVRRDLSRLITKYYFLPRKELRLGELLQRLNNLLFEHHIRMAYEFGLLAKALFVAEGIAQKLDPDFDYNHAARPVIAEIRRRYYSLDTFVDDSIREWRGLRRQLVDLPRRLNTVVTHLEQGTVRVRLVDDLFDLKENDELILVNRISFALLITGLLIASVLLLAADPTGWLRWVALGGLALDALFMLLLLIALLKSGRLG